MPQISVSIAMVGSISVSMGMKVGGSKEEGLLGLLRKFTQDKGKGRVKRGGGGSDRRTAGGGSKRRTAGWAERGTWVFFFFALVVQNVRTCESSSYRKQQGVEVFGSIPQLLMWSRAEGALPHMPWASFFAYISAK